MLWIIFLRKTPRSLREGSMRTMRLLFIRHGDPDYEHDDLTPGGKREAELLAERMVREEISEFYVSPMGRAQATAAPTLQKTGREAVCLDWLKEFSIPVLRPDRNGELSRIPWDWLPQDWLCDPRLLDPFRWRENEIMASANVGEAYDQVIRSFDALLAEHGYQREGLVYRVLRPNTETLAFFCHFGLSCVLMSRLMNCSPMVLWQGLCMAPSSVTTVYTEERRAGTAVFRTASVGDISHLYRYDVRPAFAARFCEIHGNGDRED